MITLYGRVSQSQWAPNFSKATESKYDMSFSYYVTYNKKLFLIQCCWYEEMEFAEFDISPAISTKITYSTTLVSYFIYDQLSISRAKSVTWLSKF